MRMPLVAVPTHFYCSPSAADKVTKTRPRPHGRIVLCPCKAQLSAHSIYRGRCGHHCGGSAPTFCHGTKDQMPTTLDSPFHAYLETWNQIRGETLSLVSGRIVRIIFWAARMATRTGPVGPTVSREGSRRRLSLQWPSLQLTTVPIPSYSKTRRFDKQACKDLKFNTSCEYWV